MGGVLSVDVGPDEALRAKVRDTAMAWLKQQPQVRFAFTSAEVEAASVPPRTPASSLSIVQRFHESYDADRSGDIAVAYAARTSFGVPRGPGDVVAGHGSPWDHDREVPILFWWAGATHDTRNDPIETVDIAPTIAYHVTPFRIDVQLSSCVQNQAWSRLTAIARFAVTLAAVIANLDTIK